MPAPFKLDQTLPITRGTDGKFQEYERDVPPNPLAAEDTGKQPQEWAPGVGQNTAPLTGQVNPYPPAVEPKKPMRTD